MSYQNGRCSRISSNSISRISSNSISRISNGSRSRLENSSPSSCTTRIPRQRISSAHEMVSRRSTSLAKCTNFMHSSVNRSPLQEKQNNRCHARHSKPPLNLDKKSISLKEIVDRIKKVLIF